MSTTPETAAALLSRTFAWARPADLEAKPWRVAHVEPLREALVLLGYLLVLPTLETDSDEALAARETARKSLVWTEYDGFDRHGCAQVRVGFRDNRGPDHAERVDTLAATLRDLVKPWGFRVQVIQRFGVSDSIQIAG